jgi:hypothetical protein
VALADLVPEPYRAPGLSAAELDAAQARAGVLFPPDLCELLTETLPTGQQFPDWRTRARESLEAFREQLIDGIEFDAIHNDVWLPSWGEKPSDHAELRMLVTEKVFDAPALIPIYSHRGLPNDPLEAGNPVFSIVQTDIIVYGLDLGDYLRHEFAPRASRDAPRPARPIRFWADLVEAN